MLDLYEEVDREIPIKGRRWVMSHINVISPRDRDRIVKLGLVLTTQTNNYLYKSLERNAAKLKPEQHDDIVPLKSLLRGRDPGGARDRQHADHVVAARSADRAAPGLRQRPRLRRRAGADCRWRRCAAPPPTAPT